MLTWCSPSPPAGGPRPEALPTLLHWGAQCGLGLLCAELLRLPGARGALTTANRHGMTPPTLARSHGHAHLSSLLREALVREYYYNYLYY